MRGHLGTLLGLAMLAACATDLGGRHVGDAAALDVGVATSSDAAGLDAFRAVDAFSASSDAFVAIDAFSGSDAGPSCVPAYDCTSCCGPAPDGCGSTLACDACTDDVWCTPSSPARYASQVQAAVQSVMDAHPEYFDPVMFRDTSSWLVIDDAAYIVAVVAACNAMGLVCISDPNDDHEMRVRATTDHLAENYGIRVHSSNRTWYHFTGGICETLLF